MNKHKAVRNNINLNKNNGLQIVFGNEFLLSQNNNWAFDFIEQSNELSENNNVSGVELSPKRKLIFKWWLN